VTLHVIFGKEAEDRVPELKAIAEWLAEWAKDINAWGHNLIALGDFNIDRKGDEL
ncbi:endonuclease, partial [candidate division KSB1 bacterium]|nr:endonuclease [candidate division KSB1 bacterium]